MKECYRPHSFATKLTVLLAVGVSLFSCPLASAAAPTIADDLDDITVAEDAVDTVINLDDAFDGADSYIVSGNSDSSVVLTTVNGSTLTLGFPADQHGTATIEVQAVNTADDPDSTVTDSFVVVVNSAPDIADAIDDIVVDEDDADTTIDLDAVFEDADSYEVSSNNGSTVVNASVSGSTLTLDYLDDQNGAAAIVITAFNTAVSPNTSITDAFNVTVNPVPDAPEIAISPAPGAQSVDDNDTTGITPFTEVTIIDVDDPSDLTVLVEILDDDPAPPANGALTDDHGEFTSASLTASGFTKTANGTYSLSGSITPAQATTKIQQLVFVAVANRKPVDESEDSYFRITVTSAEDPVATIDPAVDETTVVRSVSINDIPVLVKLGPGDDPPPILTLEVGETLLAFTDAEVTDVDLGDGEALPADPADRIGQILTVTITLTPDEGTLESPNFPTLMTPMDPLPSGSSFSRDETANTYKLSAFTQEEISSQLQQLKYRAPSGFLSSSPSDVVASLVATDSHDGISLATADSARTITVINPPATISGTVGGQSMDDSETKFLFSDVTIESPAPTDIKLVITTPDPKGEFLNDSAFSGAIDEVGGIVFTGDATEATAAIRALAFDPDDNALLSPATVTFTISLTELDDTAITADSSTSVTITPRNDPPAISNVTTLALVTDDATINPFASVEIVDPDEGGAQDLSVSVRLDDPAKGTLRFAITKYEAGATDKVIVTSEEHGLSDGDSVTISGSGGYNGTYTISGTTTNTFTIDVSGAFPGDLDPKGGWSSATFFDDVAGTYEIGTSDAASASTVQARLRALEFVPAEGRNAEGVREAVQFTLVVQDADGGIDQDSETRILVEAVNSAPKILGVVDPHTIAPVPPILPFDRLTIDESESNVDLTIVLEDPTKAVLRISIDGYADDGAGSTLVTSPDHGLAVGAEITISGYGGDGLYNGTHVISSATSGKFTIPVAFNDNDASKGGWISDVYLIGDDYYFADADPADLTSLLGRLEFQVIAPDLLSEPGAPFPFDPGAFGSMLITLTAEDQDGNAPVSESFNLSFVTEARNRLVTSLSDDPADTGSLRYAVLNAFAGDHITFALDDYGPPPAKLHLENTLILDRDLTINGPGPDKLILSGDSDRDGEGDVKLFEVDGNVTIIGLTLTKGNGLRKEDGGPGDVTPGGAISVTENGSLNLSYCVVEDSQATQWGGGLDVEGALTADHCLFVNNATDPSLGRAGGAISIYSDQTCTISNTTFSGNRQRATSALGGGALYAENRSAGSELSVYVIGCTFAEDVDASEQATSVKTNVFNTSVRMKNCIVADGAGYNLDVVGGGRIISDGNNISDDSTEHIFTQGNEPRLIRLFDQSGSDQVETDPLLLPLGRNFGPTETHALRTQSDSIIDLDAAFAVFNAAHATVAYEILSNSHEELFQSASVQAGSPAVLAMVFDAARLGVAEIVVRAEATSSPGAFQDKTFTIATGDSPAIDHGADDDLLGTDQRGFWRDVGSPDVGAFESGATHRIVINEIKFNPNDGEFVEFYVLPESEQVNVEGFTIWVGDAVTPWHVFSAKDAVMNPDEGIVVADRLLPSVGSGFQEASGSNGSDDDLNDEGDTVTLKDRDGRVLTSVTYNGRFGDLTLVDESITMSPQFMGAFIPHSLLPAGQTESPGAEENGRTFDGRNAPPTAVPDVARTDEDHDLNILVLDNDREPDAADTLRVVSVGASLFGASVAINDDPRVGGSILYDPTGSSVAQALPVGGELIDEFNYVILDYHDGTAPHIPRGENSAEIVANLAKATSAVTVTVVGLNDLPSPAGDYIAKTAGALVTAPGADLLLDEVTPVRILGDSDLLTTSPIFDPAGAREVADYAGAVGEEPVIVTAPNHGLDDGRIVEISGYGGSASYNGTFAVSFIDANTFSIPVSFVDNASVKGEFLAEVHLASSESAVRPVCAYDGIAGQSPVTTIVTDHGLQDGDLITISEYGGDPSYNADFTVSVVDSNTFTIPVDYVDNDPVKGLFRKHGTGGILTNDTDRDSDDDHTTLALAGVVAVNRIDSYAGSPGDSPVTLTSVGPHGLADGDSVIISHPCAEPSYDGVHVVEVVSEDEFAIPVVYVGSPEGSLGRWVRVPEAPNLETTSALGANVILDLRANREESNVLYDPTSSAALNELRGVEATEDAFGYLVVDRHGGLGFAEVILNINGVNDAPVAVDDSGTVVFGSPEQSLNLATNEDSFLEIAAEALLANDTDEDLTDTLTVVGVFGPSALGATVGLSAGVIEYDPDSSETLEMLSRGEVVIDSFDYLIEDLAGASSVATVRIAVVGVNDTPTATDFAFGFSPDDEVLEDSRLEVGASATTGILSGAWDIDMNGDEPDDLLEVVGVLSGVTADGAVYTVNPDGSFTYDPTTSALLNGLAAGQMEEDSFRFEVTDHSLTIANDDVFSVAATSVDNELRVLANDSELGALGGVLEISAVGQAGQGFAEISVDGTSIIYTPQPNFNGDDSFTYEISDGVGGRDTATVLVRVIVTERNGNLQALDDQFSVAKGTTASLHVLGNDNILPANGTNLTIEDFSSYPSQGGLVDIDATGPVPVISYTPDPSFEGTEVFKYVISGGGAALAEATVTIEVIDRVDSLGGDDGVIRDDAFSVVTGSADNLFDVLANDNILPQTGSALSITSPAGNSATATGNGTVVLMETEAGAVLSYTPNPGFVGADSFTYSVDDGFGGTGSAVVSVMVGVLTVSSDFFTTGPVEIVDYSGSASASPVKVTAPEHGLVDGEEIEIFGYGGSGSYNGTHTVSYVNANEFTIPVAYDDNDSAKGAFLASERLEVLANDDILQTEPDAISITSPDGVTGSTGDKGGTLKSTDGGTALLYTPSASNSLPFIETFTYEVASTDQGLTATGTITIAVTSANPRASNDAFAVLLNSSGNELDVLANDKQLSIPDDLQLLTITGLGTGSNAPNQGGVVEINTAGDRLIYTPAPDFAGEEIFTYEVTDDRGRTSAATAILRVTAGSLKAANDFYSVFKPVGDAADGESDPSPFLLPVVANDVNLPASGRPLGITAVGIDAKGADGMPGNDPDMGGSVEIAPLGDALLYLPDPDFAGSYPYWETFTYEISDGSLARSQGVVAVRVFDREDALGTPASPASMAIYDDVFAVERDSAENVLSVLLNDAILPASSASWTITGATDPVRVDGGRPEVDDPTTGQVTIVGQTIVYTPPEGFVGREEFEYSVNDGMGGTGTAKVTVNVGDRPTNGDAFSVLENSVGNELDVLANDSIFPVSRAFAIVAVGTQGDAGSGASEQGGLLEIASTKDSELNIVIYTPPADYVGVDRFRYTIEDDTGGESTADVEVTVVEEGSDRAVGTITVKVTGVNDAPVVALVGTPLGQTVYYRSSILAFSGVTISEVDDAGQQEVTVTVTLDDASNGILEGGFVDEGGGIYSFTGTAADATTAIRELVFRPDPADPDVGFGSSDTTFFTISVDDGVETVTLADTISVTSLHSFTQKVVPAAPANNDNFGDDVASSGDVVVVGSPYDDKSNGKQTGAVYIYSREPGTFGPWTQVVRVEASNGGDGDEFGTAVDIDESGRTIVVGAPGRVLGGSLYVFELDANGQWQEVAELVAPAPISGDPLGTAVAVSGDTIVAGAPSAGPAGSAVVFERDAGGGWSTAGVLLASSAVDDDEFGTSVGISGSLIIVGAPGNESSGPADSGNALVFERNGGAWTEVAILKPSNLSRESQFGSSVDIHDQTVIVGAPGQGFGAAYILERSSGGAWDQANYIEVGAIDGENNDEFGRSVAIARDYAVVGSRYDDDFGSNSGSAYVYGRDHGGTDSWGLVEKILPPDGESNDHFGFSVAVGRETVAVGSHFHGQSGVGAGATYIFSLKFNNAPFVLEPIADQTVAELSPFSLTVPPDTFADPDVRDSLVLSASLSDGSALPAWLTFDPEAASFGGIPTSGDVGSISVIVTATDEDSLSASAPFTLTVTPGGPFLERGVVSVTDSWATVSLSRTYASMVVVTTPSYDGSSVPLVTRIRNADPNSSSFDIKAQAAGPSAGPVGPILVYYMVVEEGIYTAESHGVEMEAVRFNSSVTDGAGSWVGTSRSYLQDYEAPVVFGQVMTSNDDGFSTFWSRGPDRGTPPTSSELWVGKHVGEDPIDSRSDETIGYVVIEEGRGTMNGTAYFAALGADAVGGMDDTAPYVYSLGGLTSAASAVLSQAAMDGEGGGWVVLHGNDPTFETGLPLAIDEDQFGDAERNHTTEQVSCIVFEEDPAFFATPVSLEVAESTMLEPLDNWRTERFSESELSDPALEASVWGLYADPDGNGHVNLYDYALGVAAPTQGSGSQHPAVQIRVSEDRRDVLVEYERRIDDPYLEIQLEASLDFSEWYPTGVSGTEQIEASRDGHQRIIWSIRRSEIGLGGFFRVSVDYALDR